MAGRGVDIKLGGNPNTPESYDEVKKAGGLFVLGTERHEARRIDNQLRGRSGRQGDPGETQFFVSLEDTLMRVFASDMLKSMMGKLGMAEDEAIEHRMISSRSRPPRRRSKASISTPGSTSSNSTTSSITSARAIYGSAASFCSALLMMSKASWMK